MTEFVKEKFPHSKILKSVDDGINQTCYFKSNKGSSSGDSKKYVGKKFSANLIDTQDYLAVSEITKNYVENREYLNLPKIRHFDIFDGDAYVVYGYIEGQVLEFDSVYNSDGMEYYLDTVGKMLADLHNQGSPADGFGWFTLNDGDVKLKNGYSDFVDLSLSQINHSFEGIDDSVLRSETRNNIRGIFRDNISYSSDPSICHCDVKYKNLIDSDGKIHLIDWEFVRSSDPLYDLVKTERQFINRFSQRDKISDNECEKYRTVLHKSYFNHSDAEFDRIRYTCYWIMEMVECLNSCEDWYDMDSLPEVRSYYMNNIKDCIEEIQNSN